MSIDIIIIYRNNKQIFVEKNLKHITVEEAIWVGIYVPEVSRHPGALKLKLY